MALGHGGYPSSPSSVAASAVEHEQGIARPADESMHFDSADADRLLARHDRHNLLLSRARRTPTRRCLLRRSLLLHFAAAESIDVDTLAALTLDLPGWPSYPHDFFAHRKSTLTKRCLHFALLHPTGISEKSNAVGTKRPRQRGTDGLPFQLVVDDVPADNHVIGSPP